MFVRAAPPHLVEEVGKILCRLICVLSSSAKLEFVGGKFSIICGCCNFQNGEVSFFSFDREQNPRRARILYSITDWPLYRSGKFL